MSSDLGISGSRIWLSLSIWRIGLLELGPGVWRELGPGDFGVQNLAVSVYPWDRVFRAPTWDFWDPEFETRGRIPRPLRGPKTSGPLSWVSPLLFRPWLSLSAGGQPKIRSNMELFNVSM